MDFKSGKHAGKSVEEVLLKEADFAQWYISKHPDALHAKEFRRLMVQFDTMPFTKKCARCKGNAVRASAYWGSSSLMFWCSQCDHYSSGADNGKLRTIRTFLEALTHIELTAGGSRQWKREIIRNLAEGKGLPKRVGKAQALTFFL